MPRRPREFDEDQEFSEGVTFNDDYLRYLAEEVYPLGTSEGKTAAAESFYRKAAEVHGENLELMLKYESILVGRWKRLAEPRRRREKAAPRQG
jgi:hypothetical protein